jgi:hypothetical protein
VDEKCFTGSFSDEIPRDTGRYQVFGEIGRGGMGVGLPVVE